MPPSGGTFLMSENDSALQVLLQQSQQTHELLTQLHAQLQTLTHKIISVNARVDSFDQVYKRPCSDHLILRQDLENLKKELRSSEGVKRDTREIILTALFNLVVIVVASIITTSTLFKQLKDDVYADTNDKARITKPHASVPYEYNTKKDR